ncbi:MULTISPECIES: alpha/beta hydrolase [unclassified Bradyrhizobium]|uniref:alpha/beta hydrolase n=1 Tax=unclassified Bradyrhizobium TaxID=2631580 RepID=UPI0023B0E60B|nr:alpha/beta hydrolase [Bradyrhizobium sp. CSS354]MDE5464739.1 alpha/beta fold hydrolase [Bradyrhizobium sp. CSS354]
MKQSRIIFAASMVLTVFVLAACAGRPSQGVMIPTATVAGTSIVPIFVATTRQRSATDPGEMFSGERAAAVSYAAVTVSIPPDASRKIGEVQWPTTLPGDPRTNFMTVSADYIEKQAFAASIAAFAKKSGRSKVLVFVHGFNNRFDDSVYRFAQIVHDSKAPVIPVLFTWPSRGELRLRAYTYDRESANYSRDALEELLSSLTAYPAVTEVSLLAHSMGNWVALEALRGRSIRQELAAARSKPDKLKNVLLVAPDVDVDVFRSQIQRMGSARPRIALFVSQDDEALGLSKTIWGDVPRLGDIDPKLEPYRSELARDRIVTFDLTTLAKAGDDAHDRAFEDVTSVMGMIKQRLSEGQSLADQRSGAANSLGLITDRAAATGK